MQDGGSGASRLGSGQTQPSVLSLPARWKGNQPAGAGLSNLGNSCYLNSTLQCLAYVPPLAHLCLGRTHSSTCPRAAAPSPSSTARPGGVGAGAAAPCTFCIIERQLAAQLLGPRSAAVSPSDVVRHLHLFSRSFVRGRQEDSHELLTAVLDVMERDGRRAAAALGAAKGCRTIVEELFQGRWQSQVRCQVCGHESNTYESFATLPLDIGQARSVVDGLRAFTEAERLDGSNKYKCDNCRQLVPALKQTTIWDDPNVLVLHLKRFDAGTLPGKNTRHVAFTETVDLQPFMTPTAARRREEQAADAAASNGHGQGHHHKHLSGDGSGASDCAHHRDVKQQQQQQFHSEREAELGGSNRSVYVLTGVLVHQGTSLHSGHYYAYVRDSYGGWSCMNDSHVYGTTLEHVRQEQAYMLFYTRQSMKLPRPAPLPPPPPGAASGAAEVPALPPARAAGPARQVYGPQLPPLMTRRSAPNGIAAPPGAAGEALQLPLRPSRLTPTTTPSARLPAKVVITKPLAPASAATATATATGGTTAAPRFSGRVVSGDLGRKSDVSGASASAGVSATNAAVVPSAPPLIAVPSSDYGGGSTAAAAVALSEARKRKRERERECNDAAATATVDGDVEAAAAAADGGVLPAVEREVAGLKACASWKEGIKRLKVSMEEGLRSSGLPAAMREAVQALQRSGMGLQQVLALGRGDPRRMALHRSVPTHVKELGAKELRKLLRPVLMLWGPLPMMLF